MFISTATGPKLGIAHKKTKALGGAGAEMEKLNRFSASDDASTQIQHLMVVNTYWVKTEPAIWKKVGPMNKTDTHPK